MAFAVSPIAFEDDADMARDRQSPASGETAGVQKHGKVGVLPSSPCQTSLDRRLRATLYLVGHRDLLTLWKTRRIATNVQSGG